MNNTQLGVNQYFTGYYKVGVVNSITKEVEWKDQGKNLVLNQGMDNLYYLTVADQMLYGICGTGTRPNSVGSGASQISQSGATVFLCNAGGNITDFTSSNGTGYASLVQAGDMLTYANGSQSSVTVVDGNGFNLTVTPPYTFSPGQTFTVWKTTQTGLHSEISRSNSYFPGAGNCGSTVSASTIIHQRTYDFPIIASQETYNELGVGWSATPNSQTVFSRVLISPVTVVAGFHLRIIYQLQTSWTPTGSIYGLASIGNWPAGGATNTFGTQSIQNFNTSLVNTDGTSNNQVASLDPAYTNYNSNYYYSTIWISPNSASLTSFGNAVDRSVNATAGVQAMSKAAYIVGSYYCDKTGTISNTGINSIRSMGFGLNNNGVTPYQSSYQSYCFRFDQTQSLQATQILSLTFRHSWVRTLA